MRRTPLQTQHVTFFECRISVSRYSDRSGPGSTRQSDAAAPSTGREVTGSWESAGPTSMAYFWTRRCPPAGRGHHR
ncbi:hypothetical protein MPTK1_5g04060 [Marchantia polymorpha subsp. ruderalis]|uniref:Uncharacterized protein n=2 Tax=Marchantia polymorpha TaxID=3197 RepID=A0AAF6BER9_MARPO|nr:hypothetical protein MARPO_0141s0014 [Marchantia polymorpha]BBN10503.1 hypothetical protein Mp_5g04060 [Marchantia polymorpha subsp. ruderalis]|eukprot:PTQ29433.1 hypothetical protein MARPO_0141s0014 [Marchantia polymorpha]